MNKLLFFRTLTSMRFASRLHLNQTALRLFNTQA